MPLRIRVGAGGLRLGLGSRRRRFATFALAFVLPIFLPFSAALTVQAHGDDASDARRHAQRASSLAASGKCRQAVAELDKAMAILRDPALLFNRAECHRKLGDDDAALEDYRQFLSDLPKAPNRGEVEKRIAELSREDKAPPPVTAVVPPPAKPEPAPPAKREPVATAIAPHEVSVPPAADVAPATTDPSPNPALVLTAPADTSASQLSQDGGIATRPWFWITIAAVVVAAGVGTFVLLSRDSTNIPSSALGNYKF